MTLCLKKQCNATKADKLWICCDLCGSSNAGWYHAACAGFDNYTQEELDDVEFICDCCRGTESQNSKNNKPIFASKEKNKDSLSLSDISDIPTSSKPQKRANTNEKVVEKGVKKPHLNVKYTKKPVFPIPRLYDPRPVSMRHCEPIIAAFKNMQCEGSSSVIQSIQSWSGEYVGRGGYILPKGCPLTYNSLPSLQGITTGGSHSRNGLQNEEQMEDEGANDHREPTTSRLQRIKLPMVSILRVGRNQEDITDEQEHPDLPNSAHVTQQVTVSILQNGSNIDK